MSSSTVSAYLLDTVAASALIREVPALVDRLDDEAIAYLSIVSLAELRYGALKSGAPERQMLRVDVFADHVELLACTTGTANMFAMIKHDLARKGQMIPVNDIWIAATALEHGLAVVTTDAHFGHVDGLTVISW